MKCIPFKNRFRGIISLTIVCQRKQLSFVVADKIDQAKILLNNGDTMAAKVILEDIH